LISTMLSYREFQERNKGGLYFNAIAPDTVHPSFYKACYFLNIEPRIVSTTPNKKKFAQSVEEQIDNETIAVEYYLLNDLDILFSSQWS
jgi:glutamate/tyrosine decarboxylase-like PLP-dependent enzyme